MAFGRAPRGIKCNDTGWLAEQIESIGGEAMVTQAAIAKELAAAQAAVAKRLPRRLRRRNASKRWSKTRKKKRLKREATAATKGSPALKRRYAELFGRPVPPPPTPSPASRPTRHNFHCATPPRGLCPPSPAAEGRAKGEVTFSV